MRLHHPELGREITVPSERSARVLEKSGWRPGPLPAPRARTTQTAAKTATKPQED